MRKEYPTIYYYIAKNYDGKEWYFVDVDVENNTFTWTCNKNKALKQGSEVNANNYIKNFFPDRKDIYIKGINEFVEISYTDYVPF